MADEITEFPILRERIDNLPVTANQHREHELPAMRDGVSVRLSVAQILSRLIRSDLAEKLFAEDMAFDPGMAGPLAAQTVQAAIDELVAAALLKAGNLAGLADPVEARANIGADPFVGGNTLAPHENLILNGTTSTTTVDINFGALLVKDSNGNGIRIEDGDLTVNITASGANGLDTGSEATSTWYHIWVIYNPTTTTIAGLFSTASTFGSLTLPSGYTHAGYVGAIYNGSGGNLSTMYQVGTEAFTGYNSGNMVLDGTATNYTAINLSDLVPTTAKFITFDAQIDSSPGTNTVVAIFAPDGSGTTDSYGRSAQIALVSDLTNRGVGSLSCPILTAQQIKYRVNGTNGRTTATRTGWRY